MNKIEQIYLDLCTSWQCEPKYKEDVMLIIKNMISKKKRVIDPNKLVQVHIPVPQEYRISACFNILFGGRIIFKTKVSAVDEMLESIG